MVIASRLCAAAGAGGILAGEVLATLAGSRGGLRFGPVQRLALKGLTRPVPAVEVLYGATPERSTRPARTARRRESRRGPRGPALVGRDTELAVLLEEFAEAAAGELRCVLLVGEPGVGKTRLARELTNRRTDEATVLHARANPMAGTVSFGLWAEALDPELAELGDDEVADLCGGFLDDLAGLFHRVAAVRGTGSAPDAPTRLFAGLTRMLDELAARRPMVVLLDDVHWADASSWEVLRHVARRLDAAPILLILTARPAELAAHAVAGQVLFELDQDDLLTRIDLGPLDAGGLRALCEQVAGSAPPALVDWLTERSAGNALFAIGLLRALLEEGADLTAPVLRRLPENLSERIVARLRAGDASTIEVYEVLAVLGRPASLPELVEMTGRPAGELELSLATLVASRGIREEERGRSLTYDTTHPLVRDIAYAEIGGAGRRRLHRRIGQVLRAAGRIAEAAVHYARAAEPGDGEAVAVLLEALGEAESRGAFREAIGLLGELLELLPDGDDRWLAVLDVLDWRAEWLADHRIEAHAAVAIRALRAMDRLLERTGDGLRRGEVNFRLGSFFGWGVGDVDEAERAYRTARGLFASAAATHQVLMVDRELAWVCGMRGDFAAMLAQSEAVVAAALAAGDEYAAMQALASTMIASGTLGRVEQALEASARTRELSTNASRTYRTTASVGTVAMLYAWIGEPATALSMTAEARRASPDYRDTLVQDVEVGAHWFAGHYRRAAELGREVETWAPIPQIRRLTGMIFLAQAMLELGDLLEAERVIARAEGLLRGRDWLVHLPCLRWTQGVLLLARGQSAAGLAVLEPAAERLAAMGADLVAPPLVWDLAEAACEAKDLPAAGRAADSAAALAARLDRPLAKGIAAATAALQAIGVGHEQEAITHAQEAVALLDAGDCAGFAARAHALLGQTLLGTDRAAGIAELEEAARRFAALEAHRRREQVLALLHRQGSAGRRASAAARGPGRLTERELDVARLAAQGLTAREIGESLFIGERTVETHLSRIYAKLAVDSKLDLVRRAAEFGLG